MSMSLKWDRVRAGEPAGEAVADISSAKPLPKL